MGRQEELPLPKGRCWECVFKHIMGMDRLKLGKQRIFICYCRCHTDARP